MDDLIVVSWLLHRSLVSYHEHDPSSTTFLKGGWGNQPISRVSRRVVECMGRRGLSVLPSEMMEQVFILLAVGENVSDSSR
eukprot:scaffold2482_cov166-Amphora_coffeaeformis.AAC.7